MEINKLKEIAAYALSKAKEMGADDAQCRVRYSVTDEINIDAGEFSLMRSTFDNSLTINVIKDMKKGTIAINKLDKASIDAAAKECVEAAEVSAVDDCLSIAPVIDNKDFSEGVLESDRDKFFDRIEEYATDIKEQFPKVFIEQLIADFYESKSVFANTNGVEFSNRVAYYSAGAMYSAHDGDKTTSFNSNGVDFYNLDEKIIDKGMQKQMYKLCEKELEAEPFEGKFTGRAIFAPSCVTDIVGAAISNFTSDGALIEGTTPWKDMLHKKVASDSLTVSAIPLDKRVVGGERYTGEGYLVENGDIIKDGVLETFTLSEYAARKTGQKRCKCLSSCIEIKNGDKSIDDIIKSIDKGILVCRTSGGSPAQNGDFSSVAKNSFLIENGKITKPVLETMISANLDEMLKNIVAISKETVEDGSCVLPYIAFDKVTVSGK